MTPIPLVNQSVATAVHNGVPCGQAANLEPSLTGGLLGTVGGVGARKRRLPTGGAAYGMLEKL